MKVRIFSFAPVIFSWLGMGEKKYYGYCGAGVYQWSEPSTVGYDSSSGTEFGFRFGGGFKRNLIKNIDFGANLEWNHMFNMQGRNFNLNSINNLELSLSLIYNFK
jgi:opacity protein-like surface antigen